MAGPEKMDNLDVEADRGSVGNKTESGHETTDDAEENAHDIVDFEGPDDLENPMNWSTRKKSFTIFLVTMMTILSPIGSTISSAAAPEIMAHFHSTNQTLGAFVTTVYLLGYTFGPMAIAPLSEMYGRSPLYKVCIVLFVIFNVACAVSPNLAALVIFRFLAGVGGSCPVTLGTGSIADMIPHEKRAGAMAVYVIGVILGPAVGPICGGFLAPAAGWRWTFWLMAIAGGVVAIAVLPTLPETYAYVLLQRKTRRLVKATGNLRLRSKLDSGRTAREHFAFSIGRPLKMLCVPVVFLQSLYAAVVYGYLYLCFTTFPAVFGDQYGFGTGPAGLVSLGFGVGSLIGIVFCGAVSDRQSAHLAKKHGGERKPEYRLPLMIMSSALIPVGLFWYGWSAEAKVHWMVPIIGTGFLGCGVIVTYMASTLYLIDAYTVYAASVTASGTILRCLIATVLPLAGSSMYDRLGFGWGNSLLGFIAVAFMPLPVVFYVYGERIRKTKRFQVNF
ncbi:cycloheximide resistance protein [Niveomyces insectorum RCEF 264]|uniref:Cycloheximide resistance protein n=1 Tax=Niveomyces insectorum RCEF 264 TaxID=1081102 RepID=A0A167W913_9HYPO|nr:cycloheximide resistance protein [Niveomyces insectorum RCEF 264]